MTGITPSKSVSFWDQAMEYSLYFIMAGIAISNAMTSVGVGIVLGVWALRKICLREGLRSPKTLWALAVVLFLGYAASLLNSQYLGKSLYALFFKYGKYLLLMFAIEESVREKRVAVGMALVACVAAMVLCWDAFYQFFSGRDLLLLREPGRLDVYYGTREFHFPRVTATFPAANTFASYLVPILMLALALSFFYANKKRGASWIKAGCLGSILAGLLLTFSRGGILACLSGVLVLIMLAKKKILWLIPVIFLAAFLAGKNLYGNRAASADAMDPTLQTRILMLQDATEMFRTHPWTGIGLNTYYKVHEKSRKSALPPSYAHNTYVQMLTEVGIIGTASFLALLIYWFGYGLRALRRSCDPEAKLLLSGVIAGVFGLCVASFFDNVLFEMLPATLFWILLGWGSALMRFIGKDNPGP
jgi:hypothetical protein